MSISSFVFEQETTTKGDVAIDDIVKDKRCFNFILFNYNLIMSKLVKFKYVPGSYPLPMIMVNVKPNEQVYNEQYKTSFGKWNKEGTSFWTIGSYMIVKDKEISSYKYNEFANLVWLLRTLNKEVSIYIDERECEVIQSYYPNEFIEI